MKHTFKRLFAMMMALAMVFTMLPVSSVFAAETDAITTGSDVAKIGDTGYATLQAAVNAASEEDVIVALTDISDADVTIGKAVTLDLNGQTLTDAYIIVTKDVTVQNGSIVNTNESYPLVVQNGGKLTIENVAIEASKSDRAIWIREDSYLVFNSGSLVATKGENNTKSKIYGIWVAEGATAEINGGSINVDAGANATAVAIFGNYTNTVIVNDGKISTSGNTYSYAIWADGDVTVTGGEIITNEKGYGYSSGITYGKNYAINSKGNVTIEGGKITTNGPSGYLVNAGGSNQQVTISDVEFTNVLSEVDKSAGGHSEPNLINGGNVTATITGGEFNGVNAQLIKGTNSTLAVSGGEFSAIDEAYVTEGATVTVAGTTYVKSESGLEEVKPAEVATYDELVAALANGGEIVLTDDITVDTKITVIDGTVIDLNGKTLYINVENSYYNNATIKNGNIVLGKDDVHTCDGYFLVNAGKTLTVDGVKMTSSANGIKGYAVFHLKTGANLDLINSNLEIVDNEYEAGYIVYAGEATATADIIGSTVVGTNTNGIVHATTVIEDSTFTVDANEHGINRSGVTITDSNVTISGGTGRGITAQHGDLVIDGTSVVSISDMGEATIELRGDKNLTIADTASVTLDADVNNTTSGTITGTINLPASGTVTVAYAKEVDGYVRIWGEGGGNASESYVLKLYSGETLMATTQLNNIGGIIDGDVYVTWNFFYPQSYDEYWTTTWEAGHPNALAQPDKVVLYIDGEAVAQNVAKMSAPDDLNPVKWEELGGVQDMSVAKIGDVKYTDLHEAMVACKSGETVELIKSVDLAGTEWEPVSFKGTFNGNGYIISNLTINKPGVSNVGFITSLNGTFKNVTFTNPTVTGGENTGVVAGRAGGGSALAEDITVNGTIKVETTHSGYARAGVIVGGWAYGNYKNITVDGGDKSVSYIKHTGGGDGRYVGGIVGHADDVESYINCTVKNITISGGWLCGAIAGPGPSGGLASGCAVENVNMDADYSGGMFGWYFGDGTIENSTIKDVAFVGGTTNNGAIGGYGANPEANVTNVTIENVTNGDKALLEHVAKVDGAYYFDLQSAINAANGKAVTMLTNVVLTEKLTVAADLTVTLDLNGKVIDGRENCNIAIASYGNLTVKDSSAEQTGAIMAGKTSGKSGNTVNVCRGTFTLESGSIYSVNNALLIDEKAAVVNINGGKITAEPTTRNSAAFYISSTSATELNITDGQIVGYNGILLWNNTTINMTGGSIEAKGSSGIQGNGTHDNTEISISGDASVSGYYTAIYHPQGGKLNISEGATLTGWTGVVIKAGTVNISGGTISGTGAADAYRPVSSGFVDTGDGLYVEHYDNSANSQNYGTPVVSVTGGTFTSVNANAIATYANPNNNVEALSGFVTGGTFNKAVAEEVCAEGFKIVENSDGFYGVVARSASAHFETAAYVQFAANKPRESLNIKIYDIYAKESLVVKVYSGETLLVTTTYRNEDLDVPGVSRYPLTGDTSMNIVISGKVAGSWDTVWHVAPSVDYIPNKLEVYADGILTDTWTGVNEDGMIFTSEAEIEEYKAFEGVYKAASVTNADGEVSYYATLADAIAAAKNGDTVTLLANVELASTQNISKSITIDGNGYTITQVEGVATNNHALFYLDNNSNVIVQNVVFDGINGSVIRTVNANVTIDNCVFQNGVHTGNQGIVRLNLGSAVVKNSQFLNNTCTMALSFNYDAGNTTDTLLVDNCLFENNTCSQTAVMYYVTGQSCTLTNSEFVNNTLNCNSNGATVYLGFTENNVVTNNLFENNSVVDASTSKRVAGAIFFGYETEISGNAFVGNTAANANGDVLGQICTSTYYECEIDLNGNYWGGNAPVYGTDYTVQNQTGDADFVLDSYYTDYSFNADGNVVLSNEVAINNIAQVGKFAYTSLQAAFDAAADGDTIVLLDNITMDTSVSNTKEVTLDLAGKTITGTDNTSKNFGLINNTGVLTIDDSVGDGKITLSATVNSGWNRYSAVISNNPGGTLIVENGIIEHLGGTDMAYGIDSLTNGGIGDVSVTINGGTVNSSYRAIRQFLNSDSKNNELIINGGTVEGVNNGVFFHDPSTKANNGKLVIGDDASVSGVYLFVTEGSTEWPVEVSISTNAVAAENVTSKNVPENYGVVNVNGVIGVIEVPELPTANVTEVANDELTFALNFKADEATVEQLAYYGDWYADFVLTVNKDVTFYTDGGDGYLSGQYDEWSENWINVPFNKAITLKAGESVKIMELAAELMNKQGLKLTYNDVYNIVKNFNCGVYFTDLYLIENPDLEVTLELRMYNPADESESYSIGQTFDFEAPVIVPEMPTATITKVENDDLTFAMNFKTDAATAEQLAYYGDWFADFVLTVNKDVTFYTDGGNGYLSGQYDAYSPNWINVPYNKAVTLKAGESVKIMELAAELMNKKGLKYTYAEVYNVVKDFNCGVFFEPEFLAANPDLEVTLELRMFNPADESESYLIGETYTFEAPKIVAENVETGAVYATAADALMAAKAGETVRMLTNSEETGFVAVPADVTFDLNGYQVTAMYVASYGSIVDTSVGHAGKLVVSKERLMIRNDNKYMPIKDSDGAYHFVDMPGIAVMKKSDVDTGIIFMPYIMPDTQNWLKAGFATSGVSIRVYVEYTTGEGVEEKLTKQVFEYKDEMVQLFVDSWTGSNYSQVFNLVINNADEFTSLKITAAVTTEHGVEFLANTLEF